uniref:Uncharacterized protein n=1 Tax=Amphilophus citrinellus TaxID=61819 RepID=A0A3Q0SRA0_AMPCI
MTCIMCFTWLVSHLSISSSKASSLSGPLHICRKMKEEEKDGEGNISQDSEEEQENKTKH